MATAEYVTKVHAVCTRTGNLANYSYRLAENEDLVLLGEKQSYEPLSRAAFFNAMKAQKMRNEITKKISSEEPNHVKNERNRTRN